MSVAGNCSLLSANISTRRSCLIIKIKMSDKGRRRKVRDCGDSEKLSEDSYEDNEIAKGSEEVRLD